jgi:hypothetical protein
MKKTLIMLASVALFSSPVMAQDNPDSALPAAEAVLPEDATSLLVPTGAWLVGPTTLADGSATEGGMPCVMVNKFSNQMEMRLSGGGEEILALALNVGSATFTADQSYLMNIAFEDSAPISLPAQAFSEDTVVVGTEPGKDFYKLLKDKQSMTVKLGESVMEFSLLGVAQGLKRLEECFKPGTAPATVATATTAETAVEIAPATAPASSAQKVPPVAGIKSLDEVSAQKVNALMDEIKGKAAPAGEVSRDAAPEAPAAVAASVATPVQATPPAAVSPAEPAVVASPQSQDILSPGTATTVTGQGPQMRWRVMKGANLQNILEVWATSAQARLIWNAEQTFSVPESLALQGTFEAAVEAVLAQFASGAARPVGKIYQDSATQQKILVIDADRAPAAPASEGAYAPIVMPKL